MEANSAMNYGNVLLQSSEHTEVQDVLPLTGNFHAQILAKLKCTTVYNL